MVNVIGATRREATPYVSVLANGGDPHGATGEIEMGV